MNTYWSKLIECVVGFVDPYQQFVERMLELTEMQECVLELLLSFDHATQQILPATIHRIQWLTNRCGLLWCCSFRQINGLSIGFVERNQIGFC